MNAEDAKVSLRTQKNIMNLFLKLLGVLQLRGLNAVTRRKMSKRSGTWLHESIGKFFVFSVFSAHSAPSR